MLHLKIYAPRQQSWDALKASWRAELIRAIHERKSRLMTGMNDTFQKARIVRRGEPLRFTMQDYLNQWKVRYELLLRLSLLRLSSPTALQSYVNSRPVTDPTVLRSICNGSLEGRATVSFVELPSGAQSDCAKDITALFSTHFSNLFKTEGTDIEDLSAAVCDFCIPEQRQESLCRPVTVESST